MRRHAVLARVHGLFEHVVQRRRQYLPAGGELEGRGGGQGRLGESRGGLFDAVAAEAVRGGGARVQVAAKDEQREPVRRRAGEAHGAYHAAQGVGPSCAVRQ